MCEGREEFYWLKLFYFAFIQHHFLDIGSCPYLNLVRQKKKNAGYLEGRKEGREGRKGERKGRRKKTINKERLAHHRNSKHDLFLVGNLKDSILKHFSELKLP